MALPLHDHRPPSPLPASRPHLVVIDGMGGRDGLDPAMTSGRNRSDRRRVAAVAPAAAASIYRRRRAGVLVTALLVCLVVSLGAARFSGAGANATPTEDAVIKVRSGETLWSIAGSLDTGRDVRTVVSDISEANHGVSDLDAGQDLTIPAEHTRHLDRR